MSDIPGDRRYNSSHEWALRDGKVVTVGISEHAVAELGDLVFIDLPAVGDDAVAGSTFGEIESVKAVSELMSPITGKIIEINDELEDNLQGLSDSPYDEGWMIRIELSDESTYEKLLDNKTYAAEIDDH